MGEKDPPALLYFDRSFDHPQRADRRVAPGGAGAGQRHRRAGGERGRRDQFGSGLELAA